MIDETHPVRAAGNFFGRRHGKPLRTHQSDLFEGLLPRLKLDLETPAPEDLCSLFRAPAEAVRMEIGFGGGEHLFHETDRYSNVGFIGVEPFINGMAKFLAVAEREGLTNIRVWDGDAALMLPRLPAGSLDAIDLLYPDPWPKRRQRKRRFVSERTLGLFARALRPGGRFRFASDIDDYVGWTLSRLLASPDFDWADERPGDWRTPYPGWIRTRYEAKAVREGRISSYLTALRRAS